MRTISIIFGLFVTLGFLWLASAEPSFDSVTAPPPSQDRFSDSLPSPPTAPPPAQDRFSRDWEALPRPGAPAPSQDRFSRDGSPHVSPLILPTSSFNRAKDFSSFLENHDNSEIICRALWEFLSNDVLGERCSGRLTDSGKSFSIFITTIDRVSGTYHAEILGKSSLLALKSPFWIERHRFYVALGFDANMEAQIVVVNYEPMVRTTPNLFPEQDELFSYIERDHDSQLAQLQDSIKNAITSEFIDARKQVVTDGGN